MPLTPVPPVTPGSAGAIGWATFTWLGPTIVSGPTKLNWNQGNLKASSNIAIDGGDFTKLNIPECSIILTLDLNVSSGQIPVTDLIGTPSVPSRCDATVRTVGAAVNPFGTTSSYPSVWAQDNALCAFSDESVTISGTLSTSGTISVDVEVNDININNFPFNAVTVSGQLICFDPSL